MLSPGASLSYKPVGLRSAMAPIRILLVDDHPIVREGYRRLLERQPGYEVVAEAGDGEEALATFEGHAPDVVLMDLSMPGLGGLRTVETMRAKAPDVRVIVVSMHQGRSSPRRPWRPALAASSPRAARRRNSFAPSPP